MGDREPHALRIRVINLSLGHPVAEPAATDPLCIAVERAVKNGIVVVTSAGNYGLTSTGAAVLGGITSPGNSPAAITVGAVDTMGTADRSDDRVAPYSSRGPTRFDFAVKPDVVAPGTRIVSLEASGSYLASMYPQWHVAGTGSNGYLRLSGTSMATGVVSGGVALLLNAEPSLTPAQVKVALQTGARFIPSAGMIAGGTGSVDFAQSLKIADQGLIVSLLSTVQNVLGLSSGASFFDRGTLIDRIYDRTGLRLLGLLDLGTLLYGAESAEPGVLTLLDCRTASDRRQPITWCGARSRTGPRATTWCGAPPFRILPASTSSGARWPTTTTWSGARRWAITAIADVRSRDRQSSDCACGATSAESLRSASLCSAGVSRVSRATVCRRSNGGCSPR